MDGKKAAGFFTPERGKHNKFIDYLHYISGYCVMSRFAAPTNELKKHTRSRYKQAETIVIYRQPTEQKSSQALQHILKDNTACLTEGFCAC